MDIKSMLVKLAEAQAERLEAIEPVAGKAT